MPETLKLFRKKSKVRTWFNGIARETLAGDFVPESGLSVVGQQRDRTVTSFTVEPF